jgi:hypothetical protein
MIKFILKNWIEIITAVGILYGIVLSTYNFIDGRKAKKLRLADPPPINVPALE